MEDYPVIRNVKCYFRLLNALLNNNNIIMEPKSCASLVVFHSDSEGRLLGWKIERKQVNFNDKSYLDCDEYSVKESRFYRISSFSYHFQPRSEEILFYRIDLENGKIHVNPDPRCGLSDHISGEKTIELKNFNLYLALLVALKYVSDYGKYPFDQANREVYNRIIEKGRRRLESE